MSSVDKSFHGVTKLFKKALLLSKDDLFNSRVEKKKPEIFKHLTKHELEK